MLPVLKVVWVHSLEQCTQNNNRETSCLQVTASSTRWTVNDSSKKEFTGVIDYQDNVLCVLWARQQTHNNHSFSAYVQMTCAKQEIWNGRNQVQDYPAIKPTLILNCCTILKFIMLLWLKFTDNSDTLYVWNQDYSIYCPKLHYAQTWAVTFMDTIVIIAF